MVFVPAAAAVAALLLWGFLGLPHFGFAHGPYGNVIRAIGVRQRHVTNVVAAVVFDYRGFDTVGEEFIFVAAVIGVAMLLRAQREESEGRGARAEDRAAFVGTSDALRVAVLALVGPVALLGLYVVTHGQLTPGGGFQGGLLLGAAPLLVYLAGQAMAFERLTPMPVLDLEEGSGAAGFVVVGLIGMMAGGAYLQNVLPLGVVGAFFSGGTLPVINLAVGLEVSAGVVMVVVEFVHQSMLERRRR